MVHANVNFQAPYAPTHDLKVAGDRAQIHLRRRFLPFAYNQMESPMAWNTPKIVEVPLGAEINSYVCGEKK